MSDTVDPILAFVLDDLSTFAALGVKSRVTLIVNGQELTGEVEADTEFSRRTGEFQWKKFESAGEQRRAVGPFSRQAQSVGLDDTNIWNAARRRRYGLEQFGGYVHHETARRVRDGLFDVDGNVVLEERLKNGERLAEQIGDKVVPVRRYCHLTNVQVIQAGGEARTIPNLRVRLCDVSAWYLPDEPGIP